MAEKSNKRKKRLITEEDASTLLRRYSVNTVLTLLQEVDRVSGKKIDWNEMVRNTATGIFSAREYQMLWRHLAYGQTLNDQSEISESPVDDDSDLEYEPEPFPAVGRETSVEAAACVRVLIDSVHPNDFIPSNSTIDAPLIINIPTSKASNSSSDSSRFPSAMQGTNIIIPVSVQKQPLSSGICGEKRPNNGTSGINLPPRRKRRGWSTEEDVKLEAAVKKYGERNWANIARVDFCNDRKASELSQRWSSLRKKQGNVNFGTSSQLSETQLAAAHRAMSLALNMPMGDNLKAVCQTSTVGTKSQHLSQKASASPPEQQLGRVGPPKSQVPSKWPTIVPTSTPDSMVKAAAVAAGARIATSADASSLIEATRSQNVVHITTGGITNQLPSNVHFIRNGLAKAPISAYSAAKPNISRPGEARQTPVQSVRPAALVIHPNPVGTSPVSNLTSTVENAASLEFAKNGENPVISTSGNDIKEGVQRDNNAIQANLRGSDPGERIPEDQSVALGNQTEVEKHQTSVSGNVAKGNALVDQASVALSGPTGQIYDDRAATQCLEVEDDGKQKTDNERASKGIHDTAGQDGSNANLLGTNAD